VSYIDELRQWCKAYDVMVKAFEDYNAIEEHRSIDKASVDIGAWRTALAWTTIAPLTLVSKSGAIVKFFNRHFDTALQAYKISQEHINVIVVWMQQYNEISRLHALAQNARNSVEHLITKEQNNWTSEEQCLYDKASDLMALRRKARSEFLITSESIYTIFKDVIHDFENE
jgi:hypothetical protein